jgi:hypothetical protein
MAALDTIADRQAQWSVTANNLKSVIDWARLAVFGFSVLGAILATVASQMGGAAAGTAPATGPRAGIAIAGAISLGFATFFTQRLLGQERVTGWVRARAISEALKREAYKFAAGAAPYDQANAEELLNKERQKIEADGEDLLRSLAANPGKGSVPRVRLAPDDYVAKRVDGQMRYYSARAEEYGKVAWRLRLTELLLAAAATAITAIAGVTGNDTHLFGFRFDIAALTAVLTTIAGAVLAHVEASRFDYLVTTYRATARRLEDRKGEAHAPISAFVNDCETIIATENLSWIAKWTKPAAPP